MDEDGGRKTKTEEVESILIVYSEKQAVVSTVMCTRVEKTVPEYGSVLESSVQVQYTVTMYPYIQYRCSEAT